MQSKSALRGRKTISFIELWCLVASGGNQFWVSWISFPKSNIGCPQQPPTEKVLKLDFWWFIPQKWTRIGHFRCQGSLNHQDQYIFWWNEAVEVIEATEAVEAIEVIEAAEILRPGKSLLRTSESSRHLNLALFFCFEKKKFWGRIMKYHT